MLAACGWASKLLFADGTPDHAAVDQAVELVKQARAAHASGLVNAVLRRAAREAAGESLLGDDRLPRRRGRPLGAALAGADVVAGARRGRGPLPVAACNEPAEKAFRVNTLRADRERCSEAARGRGKARPRGEWPLAAPEMIVVEGQTGERSCPG